MATRCIYLVLTSFFPTPTSWRCAFIYDQVKAIQKARPKWRIIVLNFEAPEDYIYQGVEVWGGFRYISLPGSTCYPQILEWLNMRRMLQVLRSHQLDFSAVQIIHAHMPAVAGRALAAKRNFPNAKIYAQLHLAEPTCSIGLPRFGYRIYYAHIRSILERVDGVISISNNITKLLLSFPHPTAYHDSPYLREKCEALKAARSIHPKKIILLHNGVDRTLFNPNMRKLHDGFIIGCIANFSTLKDQITLLRAVDLIKDKLTHWKLRFIGSGERLEYCKAYVRDHNLESYVTFETEVDHTQLPDFYRSLDLFCLPSYSEAFGCVFTEAHACGTPFITCEGQGMDDFISHKDRSLWLAKIKDPSDLAAKILYFYNHRDQQTLSSPIDIDALIPEFLSAIGI